MDQFRRNRLFSEQPFGQFVAEHRQLVEQVRAPEFGVVGDFRGNFFHENLVLILCRKDEHLHLDEIDDAAECSLEMGRSAADRQVDRNRPALKPLLNLLDRAVEVRPLPVHLVDKRQSRHMVAVGLPPDGFALGLDTLAGAEDHDRAVEHSQAAFHFGREVHVPRRVNQVDRDGFPGECHAGRVDRNPPLLLLRIVVGDGRPGIDAPEAVAEMRVEQHSLGDGRLSGVDVGNNPNIPELSYRRHCLCSI